VTAFFDFKNQLVDNLNSGMPVEMLLRPFPDALTTHV